MTYLMAALTAVVGAATLTLGVLAVRESRRNGNAHREAQP